MTASTGYLALLRGVARGILGAASGAILSMLGFGALGYLRLDAENWGWPLHAALGALLGGVFGTLVGHWQIRGLPKFTLIGLLTGWSFVCWLVGVLSMTSVWARFQELVTPYRLLLVGMPGGAALGALVGLGWGLIAARRATKQEGFPMSVGTAAPTGTVSHE
jgi:hypothetical protein